jgi:hypothetical protein
MSEKCQQATLQVWPDLKAAPTKAALYRSKAAAIKATESTLRAIATVMDIEPFMPALLSRSGAQPAFSSPIDAKDRTVNRSN